MAVMSGIDPKASFALDTQGLVQLKAHAASDPQRALKSAAQQFEAVFVDMLLKSMRATLPKSGLLDSNQTQLYTSMLDSQVAQGLASRGIGLADLMVKQLQHTRAGVPANAVNASEAAPARPQASATKKADALREASPIPRAREAGPDLLSRAKAGVGKLIDGFAEKLLPHALAASEVVRVPAFFMLGQAALETGWGRKEIVGTRGEPTHNLFGIKAGKDWNGKVVEATTTEWVNGEPKKVVEKFRAYDSYAEAFADYGRLLVENPRYAEALQKAGDIGGFAQALQKAGYATDPHYASKLTRTIGSIVNRYSATG